MRTNAHILINETLIPGSNSAVTDLTMLETETLRLEIKTQEPKMYASLEWFVPSILFAFIAKPYFDSFLSQMGSNHYSILKEWIYKQNKNLKGRKVKTVTSSYSTQKNTNSNVPKNLFTLYLSLPKGGTLKVYMPNCESDKKDIEALASILEDIKNLYLDPNVKNQLSIIEIKEYDEVFAVYDVVLKKWEFLTSAMIFQQSINTREKK